MSKIDCGQLSRVAKDGIELQGPVRLGDRLDGTLTLRRHPRAGTSNDHPDHLIEYTPANGKTRPIGAGWIKNSERAADFISMTLDDPDWPGALNLTAFPPSADQKDSPWAVVWSRPRGARVQDQDSNSER